MLDNILVSSRVNGALGIKTKTTTDNDNSIVVNINNTDRFSKANLKTLERLIVKEAFPELYDNEKMPKGLTFHSFELYDIDTLYSVLKNKYGKQKGRASNNEKYDKIKNNILDNGFKLKYNPIAICKYPDGSIKFITGRTRTKILKNTCDFKNAIVAVYTVADNKTLATQNIKFNLIDSPTGLATTGDVIATGQELVSDGDLSGGGNSNFGSIPSLEVLKKYPFNTS